MEMMKTKGLGKLSQRAGIIRKLAFVMPREKLTVFAEGIFFSLLNYCLEIFGNVWGLSTYDETSRSSTAFRKEDNQKLQVFVNKVLCSLTGLDKYTSAAVLCSTTGPPCSPRRPCTRLSSGRNPLTPTFI